MQTITYAIENDQRVCPSCWKYNRKKDTHLYRETVHWWWSRRHVLVIVYFICALEVCLFVNRWTIQQTKEVKTNTSSVYNNTKNKLKNSNFAGLGIALPKKIPAHF